jgi:hypothetical protein
MFWPAPKTSYQLTLQPFFDVVIVRIDYDSIAILKIELYHS